MRNQTSGDSGDIGRRDCKDKEGTLEISKAHEADHSGVSFPIVNIICHCLGL